MTYEYLCGACGHRWEAQQRISEDPLKDCPTCGQAEAKRQISAGGGFILKGGGWYSDLYSSAGNKAPKTESSPTTDATSGGSEKKADAKSPAATSTSTSVEKSTAPTASTSSSSD